ncbi:hypothetical protein [Labrys wisconsinensis]|uniref:DUF1127 domain-containing protein n=1 Tax=Labrys wisconsinensis TaxID=425677 RepID=A0ABU0JFB2_9HYPH|nr:hypothetical protein [Labrys wisconsinensis]MDQ0472974.1 hypothetical protein [Labrys wisconsinensis]
MIFASIIARIQDRLAKRRRYLRLVAEIESLTQRDLADVRGDVTDMLNAAWHEVYGH